VAAIAALAGGGAGMLTKGAILGDAYEREDIGADALRTGVSAAGAGMTQAIQAGMPMTSLLARGFSAAPGAQLSMATDLALSEDEITWSDVGQRGLQAGGEVAGTALGETLDDTLAGPRPDLGRRMIAAGYGGALENAVGTGADLNTYEQGPGAALARIAGSAARGGVVSSIVSVAEHTQAQRQQQEQAAAGERRAAEANMREHAERQDAAVHHAERQEARERRAAERALAGTEPTRLAEGEAHAGDDVRADVDVRERARARRRWGTAEGAPEGTLTPDHLRDLRSRETRGEPSLPAEPRPPETHLNEDVPRAEVRERARRMRAANERAAAERALAGTAPQQAAPDAPNATIDEIRAEVDARERTRAEQQGYRAEYPPGTDGSLGYDFDPTHVPGPFEAGEHDAPWNGINWPPNNGHHTPQVPAPLDPHIPVHRRGPEGGGYFSPEHTPIAQRSMPPEYDFDTGMEPLDYTPEEHYYEVGPEGLTVNQSQTGPAFNQPGGGLQYQAQLQPGQTRPDNVRALVQRGALVEQQANFAGPASPEEIAEIEAALEEEAELRRRSHATALDHYAQ
jgi:hypothetical protein